MFTQKYLLNRISENHELSPKDEKPSSEVDLHLFWTLNLNAFEVARNFRYSHAYPEMKQYLSLNGINFKRGPEFPKGIFERKVSFSSLYLYV